MSDWRKQFTTGLVYFGLLLASVTPRVAYAKDTWYNPLPEIGSAIGTAVVPVLDATLGNLLALIAGLINWIFSWAATLGGYMLDWSIEWFVLNMSNVVNDLKVIEDLWVVLRDLGNIVFIGVILYAAVAIMLDVDQINTKQTLIRVVVVALFVNFSLFVTQVVVDFSNVLALQIYDGIGGFSGGLSENIYTQLNLSSLLDTNSILNFSGNFQRTGMLLISGFMWLVVGFVMISIAGIFAFRFVVLLLLMIVSPIAFISFALPNAEFGEKWWDRLIREAFFAPAMMLFLFITLKLSEGMKEAFEIKSNAGLMDALRSINGNISLLMYFFIVIGMLIGSLIVARRISATGTDKVIGATSAAYSYAGRQTFGRAGKKIADSESLKQAESEGGFTGYFAQQTRRAGEATSRTSFDVRNTNAVDTIDSESGQLDSSLGQREGGIEGAIERQEEFREERRESLEELSPEEKERAEKAKAEKERVQDEMNDVDEDISELKSQIDERNRLENKRIEAEEEDKDDLARRYERQRKQLADEIEDKLNADVEIDNVEDFETVKKEMETEKEELKEYREKLDKEINVGKKRGQEYIEAMETQTSLLDSLGTETTTATKGNRRFFRNNLTDIDINDDDFEDFRDRVESEFSGLRTEAKRAVGESDSESGATQNNEANDESSDETNSGSENQPVDQQLQEALSKVPQPPRQYTNRLSEALDEAAEKLSEMSVDEMNEYLDTAESSPYVRRRDEDGNIVYQDRDNQGRFQEAQSGSPEELGQRRTQETSGLEEPEDSDGDSNAAGEPDY